MKRRMKRKSRRIRAVRRRKMLLLCCNLPSGIYDWALRDCTPLGMLSVWISDSHLQVTARMLLGSVQIQQKITRIILLVES